MWRWLPSTYKVCRMILDIDFYVGTFATCKSSFFWILMLFLWLGQFTESFQHCRHTAFCLSAKCPPVGFIWKMSSENYWRQTWNYWNVYCLLLFPSAQESSLSPIDFQQVFWFCLLSDNPVHRELLSCLKDPILCWSSIPLFPGVSVSPQHGLTMLHMTLGICV